MSAKKFKIQIGITRRMLKEVKAYEKEVITNTNKIAKMREDGKDEYDIRKQEEVLAESVMMVPNSKSRLESSIEDLKNLLADAKEDPEVPAEQIAEAEALITEATEAL